MLAPTCRSPEKRALVGRTVRLEPLGIEQVADLWTAATSADEMWRHLRYGPLESERNLAAHVAELSTREHQPFWAIRPMSGPALGWVSLCDINMVASSIEVGSIWLSPRLQRTRAGTEAVYPIMSYAMDELEFNRMVWRYSAENEASLRAAARSGFDAEGRPRWRLVHTEQP